MGMNFWRETAGKYNLTGPEDKTLTIIKCRTSSTCLMCKQIIPNKSYCLGGSYTRICINCAESFINNFLGSLKEYEKQSENLLKVLKSEQSKMIKNNILAKVEYNTHQFGGGLL